MRLHHLYFNPLLMMTGGIFILEKKFLIMGIFKIIRVMFMHISLEQVLTDTAS